MVTWRATCDTRSPLSQRLKRQHWLELGHAEHAQDLFRPLDDLKGTEISLQAEIPPCNFAMLIKNLAIPLAPIFVSVAHICERHLSACPALQLRERRSLPSLSVVAVSGAVVDLYNS